MARDRLTSILVPVDDSEGASRAAHFAGKLAADLGVELQLIHVFRRDAGDSFATQYLGTNEKKSDHMGVDVFAELEHKKSRGIFKQAKKQLDRLTGLKIKEVLLQGDAAAAILDYAGKQKSPLIVVGRRGKSELSELLMGSVSQELVHEAECPVTVVN
ncbi:universal stress protein [Marinospirillum sp.]|uniref:universal stress protein n=1 Tax=Marinospirillum sp. TaxID=2183934 RepID=UPI00384D4065